MLRLTTSRNFAWGVSLLLLLGFTAWMDGGMNRGMNRWMDGWMGVWMYVCIYIFIYFMRESKYEYMCLCMYICLHLCTSFGFAYLLYLRVGAGKIREVKIQGSCVGLASYPDVNSGSAHTGAFA